MLEWVIGVVSNEIDPTERRLSLGKADCQSEVDDCPGLSGVGADMQMQIQEVISGRGGALIDCNVYEMGSPCVKETGSLPAESAPKRKKQANHCGRKKLQMNGAGHMKELASIDLGANSSEEIIRCL
ncbi:hypothetical protein NDU88_000182 [Pleurodeles waltl]|uniref:Uncharacterized protein n=1 Tax=Pleurodeles waltl TaxID=8319 RepID=A0AAV7V647_PLEWA|nr:hypothetical protein NDU88_000182 [Pleurodeles waltl]